MNKESIARICELPIDFGKGNKSTLQLLESVEFCSEDRDKFILETKEYLRSHPTLVESWEIWSMNKRTSDGFYLSFNKKNIVGFYGDQFHGFEKVYKTPIDACSEFIYFEILSITNVELMITSTVKFSDLFGMTVNERLFVCGLMDEFYKCKENDKGRAIEILKEIMVDDDSINRILKINCA